MRTDIDATEGTEEVDALTEEADNGAVLAVEESSFMCPMARRTMRTDEGTCTAWGRLCSGALRPVTNPSEGDPHRTAEPQALLQARFAPGEDHVFQGAVVFPAGAATDPAAAAARVGLSGVCLCTRGEGDFEAAAIMETPRGDVHNQTEALPFPFITAEPPVLTGLDVDGTAMVHSGEAGAEHGVTNSDGAVGLDTTVAGVSKQVVEGGGSASPCCFMLGTV